MGATGLLVCACGGGSAPKSPVRDTAATNTLATDAVAFAACMRSHGAPGYPDPRVSQSADHVQITITPGGLDPNSPAFKAADKACIHLMPDGRPSGTVSPSESAQDLRFADCMRSHGVPNFPDPDHDGAFTLPSGTDQQATEFVRATKACEQVQPSSLSILDQSPPGS
ncbi:MAG TPA: hypothetical protein VHX66_10535 [Solirubrobacteraceae bacterium]|nr:hypothetical protein [Solirubrobacteraceae bacterium]